MLVEQKFYRELGKEERLSRLNWGVDKRYIIFPYLEERNYSVHNLTISLKISECKLGPALHLLLTFVAPLTLSEVSLS